MKQKYYILFAVIAVISFLIISTSNSMISGKIKSIDKVDKKIKINQEKLNSAKVLNQELSQVSKIITNTLTDEKTLSNDEANLFVKELASLCDRYRISVVGLFPKVSYTNGNVLEQQFTIELECTYVQLGQFLTSLEAYDYILKVNTLDVRPITGSKDMKKLNNETLYRISVEVSIFKIVKEA